MKNILKKIRIISGVGIIATLLSACLLFTGCGKNELRRPSGVYVDDISQILTLNWNKVQNASRYEIDLNGTVTDTRRNTYSLDELEPAEYTIRVRALGDGMRYSDSDWSNPVKYVKEADSGLNYRIIDNYTAYEVAGIGSSGSDVVVDDYYRGRPVTRIAASAFNSSSAVTSIVLGKNVKAIEKRAFAKCGTLESIVIPEGVESIGEYAFQRCIALTKAELPSSLKTIGDYAFSSCTSLSELKIGENVTSIGAYAFSGCENLKTLDIPDSVTSLSEYSFYSCTSLTDVTFGTGIKEVPAHSFDTCSALERISFSEGMQTLGEYSFARCASLKTVSLPDSLTRVGDYSFSESSLLENVSLGDNLLSIGRSAFLNTALWNSKNIYEEPIVKVDDWVVGCRRESFSEDEFFSVSESELAGAVGIADYAFYNVQGIMRVRIPDSVKRLGDYAFYGIESILSVYIGNGVERIGSYSFDSCSKMDELTFGEKSVLKEIGDHAFARCTKLKEEFPTSTADEEPVKLTIPDSVERIGVYAFYATGVWRNSDLVVVLDNWIIGVRFPKLYAYPEIAGKKA